jgi:hypothetical protein
MNDDPLALLAVIIAVASNVGIALGYAGIGIYVAPKFDAAAPSFGLKVTKASALIFFITCAMTHVELALHAISDRPEWMLSPHFLLVHSIQAIAAPVFLLMASAYMSIRIFNRQLYEGLLARRIAEVRDEVLRQKAQDERAELDARIETVMAEGDAMTRTVWDALGRTERP